VRMYRSFDETWDGFTKNIRAAFDDQRVLFCLFGIAQVAFLLGPFIAIFLVTAPLRLVVALQIGIIIFIRLILAARFRTSWLGAGIIELNGATAHLGAVGDRLTIMNFAQMSADEAAHHRPRVAILDESNNVVRSQSGVLSRFEEMFA